MAVHHRRRRMSLRKDVEAGAFHSEYSSVWFAHSSCRGARSEMEDTTHVCEMPSNTIFFGVFDGHAGAGAARLASTLLPQKIAARMPFSQGSVRCTPWPPVLSDNYNTQLRTEIRQAFVDLDAHLAANPTAYLESGDKDPGTTATTLLLTHDHLVFANLGDSRGILCRAGHLAHATHDHKPDDPAEKNRIVGAGGFVLNHRVGGCLAVARALGDLVFKSPRHAPPEAQMVSCAPDIDFVDRSIAEDEFVLLACDGLFDVLSSENAVAWIRDKFQTAPDLTTVCNELVDHVLSLGSTDNISVCLVLLPAGHALAPHLAVPHPRMLQEIEEQVALGAALEAMTAAASKTQAATAAAVAVASVPSVPVVARSRPILQTAQSRAGTLLNKTTSRVSFDSSMPEFARATEPAATGRESIVEMDSADGDDSGQVELPAQFSDAAPTPDDNTTPDHEPVELE